MEELLRLEEMELLKIRLALADIGYYVMKASVKRLGSGFVKIHTVTHNPECHGKDIKEAREKLGLV